MKLLKDFFKDDSGVAAIEYAIIAAVIAVALIAIMASIGRRVENKMSGINDGMESEGYSDPG